MEESEVARLIAETLKTYTASLREHESDEDSSVQFSGLSTAANTKSDESDNLSIYDDLQDADAANVVPGIARLKDALTIVPEREKDALLQACRRCPDLVRQESHPQIFLLRHDFNVLEAAEGLVQYWAIRQEIFGERAFLPLNMTGKGALNEEDIAALRKGFLTILPRDNLGRPVLFSDLSRVGSIDDEVFLRTSFFVRCLLCKTDTNAITKGYVGIEMYDKAFHSVLERRVSKTLARMLDNALPTYVKTNYVVKLQKWTFFRLLQSSPDLQDGLLKNSIPIVANSVGLLQEKLRSLHFDLMNIPEILGGSWSANNFNSWLSSQLACQASDSAVSVSPSLSWNSSQLVLTTPNELSRRKKTEAIRDMIAAIEYIPMPQKSAYMEAMSKCPFLVRVESNPVHFLRVESNDTVAAAHRLVGYWESRKFFFKDRAFLPLTLQPGGAFSDTELSRLKGFGSMKILPNDRHGRPVLWWDASSARNSLTVEEKYKFVVYMFSVVAEQAGAQELGVVFVASPLIQSGIPLSMNLLRSTLLTRMTVKAADGRCCFTRETHPSASFMTLLVNTIMRNPKVHVTQTKEQMCQELMQIGMKREGIPIEFGGLWGPEQIQTWRKARDKIEEDRHSAWDFQPIADAVLQRLDDSEHDDTVFLETNFSEAIKGALVSVSGGQKASILRALDTCSDIFRIECDPSKYVALEGNLFQAARRMARYWKLREEILGGEKMHFSPGQLSKSVANGFHGHIGELVRLPGLDYHGRHVFFVDNLGDFSSDEWSQIAFRVLAPLCRQDEAHNPDAVLIFRTRAGMTLGHNLKIVVDFMSEAFPLVISRLFIGVVTDHMRNETLCEQTQSSPLQIEIHRALSNSLVDLTEVYSAATAEELANIFMLEGGFSRDSLSPLVSKNSNQSEDESMTIQEPRESNGCESLEPARIGAAMEATAAENSGQERSVALLKDILSKLPASARRCYDKVQAEAPNLIEIESDPRQFLRFERSNPHLAAQRLAAYWRQRSRVFDERTFRPLTQTGEGALERKDVTSMSSGSVAILPNDVEGRPVLLYDSSRLKRNDLSSETRNMFYWAKLLLENESTIDRGVVMILVLHGTVVNPQATKWFDLCHRCFPFRFHSLYVISSRSNHGVTLSQTVIKLPGIEKTRKEVYTVDDALANFQARGFLSEQLPTSIGGSWSYEKFAIWQEQRTRQEWGLPLGAVEDESFKYKAKMTSQLTEAEKVERKRRFNVLHSRRKRKRDRMEQDRLENEVKQLRVEKGNLLAESHRLGALMSAANAIVGGLEGT